jgi:TRAP-type C4-dicarboxylate transport system permease small subunit
LIKKIGKVINKIEENALTISLAIMVIVIFTNVVMRYIFNNSLSWSEEFARYLFVWFSWLGVSAGVKDNEHLRVEILSMALSKKGLVKADEAIKALVSLIWIATTWIVAYYGLIVISAQIDMNVLTPAMRIPVWIAYLAIPFCSFVVGIRLILNVIESVKILLGKSTRESEVAK